jgi:hypothetical protein
LGMAADSFGEHQGFLGEHQGNSGKASHRGHGGYRGRNLGMAADSFGEHQGFLGEHQAIRGKHRTEVTEVTEGEFGDGGG